MTLRDEFERCWPRLDASLASFGRTHGKEHVWRRIAEGRARSKGAIEPRWTRIWAADMFGVTRLVLLNKVPHHFQYCETTRYAVEFFDRQFTYFIRLSHFHRSLLSFHSTIDAENS
jgi:hypothetical protein